MKSSGTTVKTSTIFGGSLPDKRLPWHVLFWLGYVLFRCWVYYITLKFYDRVYLEYMLISEAGLVLLTYVTLWLYRSMFTREKYFFYFSAGSLTWILYLYARTLFQFYYLRNEPSFKGAVFRDMFISNLTFVFVYFLFLTGSKFFKDGYILRQSEAEKKQRQLIAEVNNLKSQIAPHFLFNTLNNLYGLAVEKSDRLPDLMLRLSDLLRHSLYETQKPLIPLADEIGVLTGYIKLESVRLEDDPELQLDNSVPTAAPYLIAPLLLIVFMENAFKHAKLVQHQPIDIYIKTAMEGDWFTLQIKNNYNDAKAESTNGIGLTNVKRRLEVLYPHPKHQLTIHRDEQYFTVTLTLQLTKEPRNGI